MTVRTMWRSVRYLVPMPHSSVTTESVTNGGSREALEAVLHFSTAGHDVGNSSGVRRSDLSCVTKP